MNIIYELIHYATIVIIGLIIVNQYGKKMEWGIEFKYSLVFILSWRTIMLFIFISLNVLSGFFPQETPSYYFYSTIHPFVILIVILILNFFLGEKIFRFFDKNGVKNFKVIIYAIVIIDIILNTLFFYMWMIPMSLVLNFNW